MPLNELLRFLFDGRPNPLVDPVTAWLKASRRFRDFVQVHQTKIRKKIRVAQDPDSLRDLQLELETAFLLLQDRSLSAVYEPGHPRDGRSPDFAVTYTTSVTFMVEVTRLRGGPHDWNRFSDVLCGKLGQLLPQHSNVLIAGVEGGQPAHDELQAAMLSIQQRAERNDPAVLERQGFRSRTDFFHHYQRLSAVLLRGIPPGSGEPASAWLNPQANHPLPPRVWTALVRSQSL